MNLTRNSVSIILAITVVFLQMLDTSVMNMAIIVAAPELGLDIYHANILITSFGVGLAISFVASGYLESRFGLKKVFLIACLGFCVFSFFCAISSSYTFFALSRLFQGIASGVTVAVSQKVCMCYTKDKDKKFVISLWSSALALAPVFGPLVGSYISINFGWRYIFFLNIPVMALCLMALDINKLPSIADTTRKFNKGTFFSLAMTLALFQIQVDLGHIYHWYSAVEMQVLLVLTLIFGAFLIGSHKKIDSFFNLSLFRDASYRTNLLVLVTGNAIIFSSMVILPIWLLTNYNMSLVLAGSLVAISSLISALLGPIVGKYVPMSLYPALTIFGLSASIVCYLMTANFGVDTSLSTIVISRVFMGISLPLFYVPLSVLYLQNVAIKDFVYANTTSLFLRVVCANFVIAFVFYFSNTYEYILTESAKSNFSRLLIIEDFFSTLDGIILDKQVASIIINKLFLLFGVINIFLLFTCLSLQVKSYIQNISIVRGQS